MVGDRRFRRWWLSSGEHMASQRTRRVHRFEAWTAECHVAALDANAIGANAEAFVAFGQRFGGGGWFDGHRIRLPRGSFVVGLPILGGVQLARQMKVDVLQIAELEPVQRAIALADSFDGGGGFVWLVS